MLEALDHAQSRDAPVVAEIRGYGTSSDGHHMSQPSPGGEGPTLAMRRALQGSGLDAGDVQYVNAHATSTPQGDDAEMTAIANVRTQAPVVRVLARTKALRSACSDASGSPLNSWTSVSSRVCAACGPVHVG